MYKFFTRTKLNTKIVQFLICSLFLSFIFAGKCSAAGSFDGSPSIFRGVYARNQFTADTNVDSSRLVYSSSPFVNGAGYVAGVDVGSGATNISGHVDLPVITMSYSGLPVQYDRDVCGTGTIRIGVDSNFWSTNASNLVITNCSTKYSKGYAPSGGSYTIGKMISFDFSADIPSRSGLQNFSVQYYSSNGDNLIYQWENTSSIYFFGKSGVYSPYFLVSFGASRADLIAQEQLQATKSQTDAINKQTEQQHQDSQALLEEQQKQTDFITSTDSPDADSIANSSSLPSVGLLPSGPLDSLLLLPVNIMNSILSSLGGSCSPVTAKLPFVNQNISFPCFGDTIYKGKFEPLVNIIGIVPSAFLLFGYFKFLYKKVDRAVSLESTDEDEWGVL